MFLFIPSHEHFKAWFVCQECKNLTILYVAEPRSLLAHQYASVFPALFVKKKVTVIIDYLKFLPTVHKHNRPTNFTTSCSVFLDKGLDRQTSTRLKSKYNESVQ